MSLPRRTLGVRFDLLAGSLLLIMVLAGCVAIRMLQETDDLSLELLAWVSWAQLALVFGGLGLLLALSFLVRSFVSAPLSRMTAHVRTMQQTGRLVKMPVTGSEELATFAATFNTLAERIEEQKARLREHVVELQESHAELERLAGVKDDFLATISHQFRTPLTSIMEGLELLQDGAMGAVSEDARRLVRVMDENVLRLDHLIEEALDLALMKSGRRLLHRAPSDVRALLVSAEQAWRAAMKAHRLTLDCPALPHAYCDGGAIREVLDHLLRNALRHAPEESEISIVARHVAGPGAELVRVAVRDAGPGMSSEQLARLFQPFVHIHTPEAPGSDGSGLGLAICRQVIERHRGTIRAESASGQGMTIIFELPVATHAFLFDEACRSANEDAQYEHGLYGILVALPAPEESGNVQATLRQAEQLLRRNTHRGDRFVPLDDGRLAIIAVTDLAGGAAMQARLRAALQGAELPVRLGMAFAPMDGDTPQRVLEAADARARQLVPKAVHATMPQATRGGGHG